MLRVAQVIARVLPSYRRRSGTSAVHPVRDRS